jgi:hypothetical protein
MFNSKQEVSPLAVLRQWQEYNTIYADHGTQLVTQPLCSFGGDLKCTGEKSLVHRSTPIQPVWHFNSDPPC